HHGANLLLGDRQLLGGFAHPEQVRRGRAAYLVVTHARRRRCRWIVADDELVDHELLDHCLLGPGGCRAGRVGPGYIGALVRLAEAANTGADPTSERQVAAEVSRTERRGP